MRIFALYTLFAVLLASVGTGPGCTCSSDAPESAPAPIDPDRFSASVVLISWGGLQYQGRPPAPTRLQAEALELANDLRAAALADPMGFSDLARDRSEGPNAWLGGRLATFATADLPEPLKPLGELGIGQISDVYQTPNGYAFYKREAPVPEGALSGRRLIVAFEGAERTPADITRTKEEAKERATELRDRAKARPSTFESLVASDSDGYDRERRGYLGTWTVGSGKMPVDIEAAIAALDVGGFSLPLRTEFGVRRLSTASTRSDRAPAGRRPHLDQPRHSDRLEERPFPRRGRRPWRTSWLARSAPIRVRSRSWRRPTRTTEPPRTRAIWVRGSRAPSYRARWTSRLRPWTSERSVGPTRPSTDSTSCSDTTRRTTGPSATWSPWPEDAEEGGHEGHDH